MTTFAIDTDNNITVFAHLDEAETAGSRQSFASQGSTDLPAGLEAGVGAHGQVRIQAVIPWRRKRIRPKLPPIA